MIYASIAHFILLHRLIEKGGSVMDESFRKYLFAYRQVYLCGEIDAILEQYICTTIVQLKKISSSPITMFIHSYGGYTGPALRMHNMIADFGNVIGCVIGAAASGAAIILQACCERKILMRNDTYVLIHNPYINKKEYKSNSRICALRDEQEVRIHDILCERSGKSIGEIIKLYDTRMSAQESLQCGLIDKII